MMYIVTRKLYIAAWLAIVFWSAILLPLYGIFYSGMPWWFRIACIIMCLLIIRGMPRDVRVIREVKQMREYAKANGTEIAQYVQERRALIELLGDLHYRQFTMFGHYTSPLHDESTLTVSFLRLPMSKKIFYSCVIKTVDDVQFGSESMRIQRGTERRLFIPNVETREATYKTNFYEDIDDPEMNERELVSNAIVGFRNWLRNEKQSDKVQKTMRLSFLHRFPDIDTLREIKQIIQVELS